MSMSAKCSVTVRLFNFLATWMETSHGSMASVANPFWRSRAFWRCTVVCVLSPSDAGFDLTDLEVANQLPNEVRLLGKTAHSRCKEWVNFNP
ncbi:hypothetical protein IscW_ISCW016754 [Ixodes scapularis]|uniref:DNA-dependent protein kinase catalytic subunit CC1/2 domain-containing protein n=1 Tax=Ixodes scapularis TaxID=6945 RepID=B7PA42_IXOSC|nr:hypothetical protein IscW_ISCW016754 [Ixodes scapularis]|eukprot:XP_002406187.1 hypothetical protein IscW_ISCW016754 [Ixodes scapularis]